jgi:hypothetical protein
MGDLEADGSALPGAVLPGQPARSQRPTPQPLPATVPVLYEDALAISVKVGVDLRIDAKWPTEERTRGGKFAITGPQKQCELLQQKLFGSSSASQELPVGQLSPAGKVDVPREFRTEAGIPMNAAHYCFVHPWSDVDGSRRENGTNIVEKLNKIRLAQNDWAYVLVQGGYAYFDDTWELIAVNAITLAPSEEAGVLLLVGQHVSDAKPVIAAMEERQRLVQITDRSLSKAGFKAFGWVHSHEKISGRMLGLDENGQCTYPNGAFLYQRLAVDGDTEGEDRVYLYSLMTPDPKQSNYETALAQATETRNEALREAKRQAETEKALAEGKTDGPDEDELTRTSTSAKRKVTLAAAYASVIHHSIAAEAALEEAGTIEETEQRDSRKESQACSWQCFRENLISLVILLAYIGLGVAIFGFSEHQGADSEEQWTWIQAVYFSVVTISTVGYGDLAPVSWAARAACSIYILGGVAVVFQLAGSLYDATIQRTLQFLVRSVVENCGKKWVWKNWKKAKHTSARMLMGDSNDKEEKLPHWAVAYAKTMAGPVILGFLLNVIFAAWVFTLIEPPAPAACAAIDLSNTADVTACDNVIDLASGTACDAVETTGVAVSADRRACRYTEKSSGITYDNAVWHCWCTSTTVGYGDQSLSTDTSKLFAALHILVSVSWLASTLDLVIQTKQKRKYEQIALNARKAQLDPGLIENLAQDRTGQVNELQYVVGMLSQTGAEICGETLDWKKHVEKWIDKFRAIDEDRSGYLSQQDIDFVQKKLKLTQQDQNLARNKLQDVAPEYAELSSSELLEELKKLRAANGNPLSPKDEQQFGKDHKKPALMTALANELGWEKHALNKAISFAKQGSKGGWDELDELLFPDGKTTCELSNKLINSKPKGRGGIERQYALLHQLAAWESKDGKGRNGITQHNKLVKNGVEFNYDLLTRDGETVQEVALKEGNPAFVKMLQVEGYLGNTSHALQP